MGNKSPRSKDRHQKQKTAAKISSAAAAKSRQDANSRSPLLGGRDKKK